MAEESPYSLETTTTSIRVFQAVRNLGEASASEVAEFLDKSRSSVYKHLQTLQANGFVAKSDSKYTVSLQMLSYGLHARRQNPLDSVARSDLQWLADATDSCATLAASEARTVVCVRSIVPGESFAPEERAGEIFDPRESAFGKAVLAHLPQLDRVTIVNNGNSETKEIPADSAMYEGLQAIRERGYSISESLIDEGVTVIAAPIFGEEDSVVGSIGVSVETQQSNEEKIGEVYGETVVNAAQKITKRYRIGDHSD